MASPAPRWSAMLLVPLFAASAWGGDATPPTGGLKLPNAVTAHFPKPGARRIPELRWQLDRTQVLIEYDGLNEGKVVVLHGFFRKPGWTLMHGDFPANIVDPDTGEFEIQVPLEAAGTQLVLKAVNPRETKRGLEPKSETIEFKDAAPYAEVAPDAAAVLRYEARAWLQTAVYWGSESDTISTTKTSAATWLPGIWAEGRVYRAATPIARTWEADVALGIAHVSGISGISMPWPWDAALTAVYRNGFGRPSDWSYSPLLSIDRQTLPVIGTERLTIASEQINLAQSESVTVYWAELGARIQTSALLGRRPLEIRPSLLRSITGNAAFSETGGSSFGVGGWAFRVRADLEARPRWLVGASAQVFTLSGDQSQSGVLLGAQVGYRF